mmetsp:Transcript_38101/g.76358  ORF Transcript_38101/g.76358 Transcript_38101/m.76358 type:complete len:414 (-) Transcript_38101:137-1378(-)|eukprot:CAMPEP_0174717684 /NCGR_PEP_ID=MMETSP1094-20130205/26926_1 /TAXON_ID=156173 /ORGANISM="Chrysochromulina brevifilum, Strain UTEX LB 985" /LENGTH=413 /DNA_ID=CAMNT_0015917651 /DNA_START=98 /DNA_END=1339 /DNA_ORIENTATION=+
MRLPAACARTLVSTAVSLVLISHGQPDGPGGQAAQAKALTEDQYLAAQAWTRTDKEYADRSFAGQDWFKRRQTMVKKSYNSREEVYDEIRSMLDSLGDRYTRFLTPAMYNAVYSVATGDVAGIGVELAAGKASDDGRVSVEVSSVVEGAPSDVAGLRMGDVLEEADGTLLRGLSPEEAASKVRGPKGSKLRLTVRRDGEAEPLVMIITRAEVKLAGVRSSTVSVEGQKVGLVRIKQFSTTTADDVAAALDSLSGAKAIVLDLRGNTGGYFPGGVDVAKLFLKAETPITYVVDKRGQTTTYSTFENGKYADVPLLILVDSKTASASEILSSALQDNERAVLVGEKTFGKAVIQTVEALDDGSAIVVTIAKYETPKRTDINRKGIFPQVEKECPVGDAAVACLAPEIKGLVQARR